MNAAEFIWWTTSIAFGFLILGLFFALVRLLRGPTLPDRVLALDLLTTLAMSFIGILAIRTGFMLYIDIALTIGLVGFLATVALARYILQRIEHAGSALAQDVEP
jgi:multicomponent Na+:H+ antiporter subunit F